MGTAFASAAKLPRKTECDEQEGRSLAEVLDGALAEVDIDSVDAVREIRRDE